MQVTGVRCGNPSCGRVLDERLDLPRGEREPCPDCGSLRRLAEVSGSATVGTRATIAWTKIHEEVERSSPWLLGSLALTVASSFVGLVLGGLPGLLVGLGLGLVSFPTGLRAATRVREIEHGGQR